MSRTAKHRDEAYAEADRLCAAIVAELELDATDPRVGRCLVSRLFPVIRARQKFRHGMLAAEDRLAKRGRHVNALLSALANHHDQLCAMKAALVVAKGAA